jgi:hypothetical protein
MRFYRDVIAKAILFKAAIGRAFRGVRRNRANIVSLVAVLFRSGGQLTSNGYGKTRRSQHL